MSQTPTEQPDSAAEHLVVQPYDEAERVTPPQWYDDTINVGDTSNEDAEQ